MKSTAADSAKPSFKPGRWIEAKKLLINGGPIGDAHSSINIFNDQGFHQHLLGWFDQWLKGVNTGILDEPLCESRSGRRVLTVLPVIGPCQARPCARCT